MDKERQLLNIVLPRGQVTMSDLVLELGSTSDQVKAWIYDLVGKGLFSGYINWNDGILYSQAGRVDARDQEMSQLRRRDAVRRQGRDHLPLLRHASCSWPLTAASLLRGPGSHQPAQSDDPVITAMLN